MSDEAPMAGWPPTPCPAADGGPHSHDPNATVLAIEEHAQGDEMVTRWWCVCGTSMGAHHQLISNLIETGATDDALQGVLDGAPPPPPPVVLGIGLNPETDSVIDPRTPEGADDMAFRREMSTKAIEKAIAEGGPNLRTASAIMEWSAGMAGNSLEFLDHAQVLVEDALSAFDRFCGGSSQGDVDEVGQLLTLAVTRTKEAFQTCAAASNGIYDIAKRL